MSTTMSREERETFLAGVHVGVLSINEEGRGPLTVPVWYAYEPGGEVQIVTERDSRKGKLLKEGMRISLCAQDEAPPYRYASVEGPVIRIDPSDVERNERQLAHRLRPLVDALVAVSAQVRNRCVQQRGGVLRVGRVAVEASLVLDGAVIGDSTAVNGAAIAGNAVGVNTSGLPKAQFPHWVHRIRYRCKTCHMDIFEPEAGSNVIVRSVRTCCVTV